jgi:taurine dioxygenase
VEEKMVVQQLSPLGGVAVEGVNLAAARSAQEDRELAGLYDTYGLVVFRDQKLTKRQLLEATYPFGGPMIDVPAIVPDPEVPGITIISTRGPDGNVVPEDPNALVGDLEWHTDQGYVPVPNRGKYLYALEVPEEGGMTGFIDGQLTYDALSDAMKARIENLHVIQSWNRAEEYLARNRAYRIEGEKAMAYDKFPPVVYPMVIRHPLNGKKLLNVPPMWSAGVVEMPGAAGMALIEELVAHITQPQFQYWHRYRVGDALIWDNWRFLHAASGTPGRYVRTLWSIVIMGGPAFGRLLAQAA